MAKSRVGSVPSNCGEVLPKNQILTTPSFRRSDRILKGWMRKSKAHSNLSSRFKRTLAKLNLKSQRDIPPFTVRLNNQDKTIKDTAHLARVFNNLKYEHVVTSFRVTPDMPTRLDTPDQMRPYVEVLNTIPDVHSVSFSGVSLGTWACYALAECLHHKTKLTSVDISDAFTGRLTSEIAPSLDALVSAFLELPSLDTIKLSDNAFGPDVQGPLVRLLASHLPLKHLYLNNTGLGPQTGVAVAQALVSLAENKTRNNGPCLRSLMCDRNHLVEDEEHPHLGMEAWAQALSANNGLVTVTMKNNGLRGHGMDILIGQGLSTLNQLQVLDLEDNTFTSRGHTHTALAEAVRCWPQLEQLNINDSLLGSRGGALLIEALKANRQSQLHTLKMRGNNLSPANTRDLASAFDGMRHLRCLEVADNNLPGSDPGHEALTASFALRSHIEKRVCIIDEIDVDEQASQVSATDDGWNER